MVTRVVHLEDLVEGVHVHGLTQQELDIIVADGLQNPESVRVSPSRELRSKSLTLSSDGGILAAWIML